MTSRTTREEDLRVPEKRQFVDGQLVGREEPGQRGIEYLGRVKRAHRAQDSEWWYDLEPCERELSPERDVIEAKLIAWEQLPAHLREKAKQEGWTTVPLTAPDQHVEVPVPEEAKRLGIEALNRFNELSDAPLAESANAAVAVLQAAAPFIAAKAVEEAEKRCGEMHVEMRRQEERRIDAERTLAHERDQAIERVREAALRGVAEIPVLDDPRAGTWPSIETDHARAIVAAAFDCAVVALDQNGDDHD